MPEIDDVISVAWSPDGRALAIARAVALPSATITGSPEDFFLDTLDLSTGELRPLGVGERQQWSESGRYLSYWSWNGELRIASGGLVIATAHATVPDARWIGDALVFVEKDEIRSWSDGIVRSVARLPPELEPRYPADDLAFSADATRFTLTRYGQDGTVRRYLGDSASGAVVALDLPNATFTEWAPAGAMLLARTADRLELRGADGSRRDIAIARFPGPVHAWAPDGRTLLVGAVAPAIPGVIAPDRFVAWTTDGPGTPFFLPNLLGPRRFSPDGTTFAGVSRIDLARTRLELFRCAAEMVAASVPPALAATAAPAAGARRFVRPVVGAITQPLGGAHTGVDIAAPFGALIVADDDGVISAVGFVTVGGRRVCVERAGALESCVYHTSAALVAVGDRVARGQPVALIGMTGVTTGPHVHWEVKQAGQIIDPLVR